MGKRLRVLLIEDSDEDVELILLTLRRGGFEPEHQQVTTARELRKALQAQPWDAALSGYSLAQLCGREALRIVKHAPALDIPVIFVSGSIGEETAAELMRYGAKDYIRKTNLERLAPAIARELAAAGTRRQQRKIAAELEFEHKLLRHLMNGIPDAIYFKDTKRRYLRLNAAELKILNAGEESCALGKTEDEFILPARAAARRAEDETLVSTGEALTDQLESYEQLDGSVLWFSETRAPLRDDAGTIIGLAGIRRNVTELKRQKLMLQSTNLHLEEFAHVASHDLRSPLRAIANTVEWLNEDLGEDLAENIREHLDRLRLQARRATSLVIDLHNYSKVGRKKELEEPVDLPVMVGEIFHSLLAAGRMKAWFEGEPASLVTAKAPLDLVLRNLIDNAIKYHDRMDGRISVRCKGGSHSIVLEVEDDGPGIAEIYHQRIFQPFQKLESYEQVPGSGLGLAIVKKTVEHFGGNIRICSPVNEGRGTNFVFDWPLRIPREHLTGPAHSVVRREGAHSTAE